MKLLLTIFLFFVSVGAHADSFVTLKDCEKFTILIDTKKAPASYVGAVLKRLHDYKWFFKIMQFDSNVDEKSASSFSSSIFLVISIPTEEPVKNMDAQELRVNERIVSETMEVVRSVEASALSMTCERRIE